MKRISSSMIAIMVSLIALPVLAQDSGFLTDYSLLKDREGDEYVDRVYVKEGISEMLDDFNAIMVDQPEILIAADSKYKGAKPDALKQLADIMRMALMERLEAGGYRVTDQPGQGVLFLHWALTDLYLKKKKRSILTYSPLGQVVHYSRQAAIKDLWKKIDIVEMTVELEMVDSGTGEILAAGVDSSGHRKTKTEEQDLVTWEELDAQMSTIGERVRCRMDNARRPAADRENCVAILIEPVYEEDED